MGNDELINEHTKIMTENDQRSRSNTHRLDKQETKVDELAKVYSALSGMETNIRHIGGKIDSLDKHNQINQQQLELQKQQNADVVSLIGTVANMIETATTQIADSNMRTTRDRVEDTLVYIVVIGVLWSIVGAVQGGLI